MIKATINAQNANIGNVLAAKLDIHMFTNQSSNMIIRSTILIILKMISKE